MPTVPAHFIAISPKDFETAKVQQYADGFTECLMLVESLLPGGGRLKLSHEELEALLKKHKPPLMLFARKKLDLVMRQLAAITGLYRG